MIKKKIEYLFTPLEIQNTITAIRKVFNFEMREKHFAIIDSNTNFKIGAIQTIGENITIVFRGALGMDEGFSCVQQGNGEIHAGLLSGYKNLSPSLWNSLEQYSNYKAIPISDMKFIIGGHSRGSGFVPQLVEDLLNKYNVLSENIRAISFSPLSVYSEARAKTYNEKFGYNQHINILIKEDKIDHYLKGLQYLYSTATFTPKPQSSYFTVGNTLEYSIINSEAFNEWVASNPFIHLDPQAGLLKLFISSTAWGSHMPEGYEITAAAFVAQLQLSENIIETYNETNFSSAIEL